MNESTLRRKAVTENKGSCVWDDVAPEDLIRIQEEDRLREEEQSD